MTGFSSTVDKKKKTDITLNNIITTLSVSFFGGKKSRANVIKVSAVILNFVRFSLFDRHDSDKPEMIYISCSLFNRSDSDKPKT